MTFFKSLFSKKTPQDNWQTSLSADFILNVQKAIVLLPQHSSLDNPSILKLLISTGIKHNEATDILIFLPIAFVRHFLSNLNWPDSYKEFINDNKQVKRQYKDTKSFQIIWEVTGWYFQNSPKSDTIIKIAGRSAEFHAINKLLNDGGKLEYVKITETVIVR